MRSPYIGVVLGLSLLACTPATPESIDTSSDETDRCPIEGCDWVHLTLEPTTRSPLEGGQVIELTATIVSCAEVPLAELQYPGVRAEGNEVAYGKIRLGGSVPASFMDGLSAGETCSYTATLTRADDWDGERARVRMELTTGAGGLRTGRYTSEFIEIEFPPSK